MRTLLMLFLGALQVAAQDFDLVLRGGRIVDGMGNPWYRADLGIRHGAITVVGDLSGRAAARRAGADERACRPGDARRRRGSVDRAHLSTRHIRQDRRTGGAREGGSALRRLLLDAYA